MTSSRFRESGFALVITLIMVVLAAVLVIGFLVSASSDRSSASTYDQSYQAQLAAESGLEAAKEALRALPTAGATPQTQNDSFIVLSENDPNNVPYYYIGSANPNSSGPNAYQNPTIQYFPLYSGGTISAPVAIAAGVAPTPTPPPTPTSVASQSFGSITVYYPKLFPSPAPHAVWQPNIRTQWQYLPTPTPAPAQKPMQYRYTYWIEDLASYVDANVAGNPGEDGTATSHQRLYGFDPKEIALFTLFSSASNTDSGSTYAKTLVGNHGLLFTPLTTRLGTTTNSSDDQVCLNSLVGGLQADTEQSIIPYGLGYKNEGSLKTNLNPIIQDVAAGTSTADQGVDKIAAPIKDNLPNWASNRRGGFTANLSGTAAEDSYRRTIAANIVAYAQPANKPPLVGSDYRGVGAYPLVNEFYDYVNWTASSGNTVKISLTSIVELWNMTNQPITGTVRYTTYYRHPVTIGSFTYFGDSDDPQRPPNGSSVTGLPYPSQAISMQANEYKVFNFGTATYTFSTGAVAANTLTKLDLAADRKSSYKLEWSADGGSTFKTIDTPYVAQQVGGYGVQKNANTIYNPALPHSSSQKTYSWSGSLPGLEYYSGPANFQYNPGDPRAAYYIASAAGTCQGTCDYTSDATLWSRNAKPSSTNALAQQGTKVSAWADGGHDTTLISPTGLSDSIPPAAAPTPPTNRPAVDSQKEPMIISNAGNLKTITELGFIFDPAQWNITTTGNKWTDITSSATADSRYGGGFTLRIGRPEFSRFDKDGMRASQLLDVFSIADKVATTGKINLNTASREVLRTLGAGIRMGNVNGNDVDQAIQPSTVYGPITASGRTADIFADAVINARAQQPFLSTAQLAFLKNSTGAFFGNKNQWVNGDGPTEWNDGAAEEYFAKIYNMAVVRSRNFRVFVTGQYIDPNTNDPYTNAPPRVIATANKVYEVFLKPTRNAAGAITDENCQITYEADIP